MHRRGFLRGILAAGVAPYVCTTAGVLMPVRDLWKPVALKEAWAFTTLAVFRSGIALALELGDAVSIKGMDLVTQKFTVVGVEAGHADSVTLNLRST